MTSQGGRVFLCHSSKDAAQAEALVEALEAVGVGCWLAPRDVESGTPYPRQLVRAIADCGVFLILVTTHAVDSEHVLRELEQAAKRRRPLLPVVVGGAMSDDLDYYLGAVHQIHGDDLASVLAGVVQYFGARPSSPRPDPQLPVLTAAAGDRSSLRVGVIPFPPFSEHGDATRHPSGLFIHLLDRFSEDSRTPVEYRAITNEQSARLINEGALDAVACLYRTPRRERAYSFAGCLYAATIGAVVRADDERIVSHGDLLRDDVRIVACQGEIGAELAADQFAAQRGTQRLIEMDTVNVAHIGYMVAAGAADVAITDNITCSMIVSQVGPVLKHVFQTFPLFVGQIGLLMGEGRLDLQERLTHELRRLRREEAFRERERLALAPFGGMLQTL